MRHMRQWAWTGAVGAALVARAAGAQPGEYTITNPFGETGFPAPPAVLDVTPGVWRLRVVGAWNPFGLPDQCGETTGLCVMGWTTSFGYAFEVDAPPTTPDNYHGAGRRWRTEALAAADAEPLTFEYEYPTRLYLFPLHVYDVFYTCPFYPDYWCDVWGPQPPVGASEVAAGAQLAGAQLAGAWRDDARPADGTPNYGALRVRLERVGVTTTVPEPSTAVLVASAFGVAALVRHRRGR